MCVCGRGAKKSPFFSVWLFLYLNVNIMYALCFKINIFFKITFPPPLTKYQGREQPKYKKQEIFSLPHLLKLIYFSGSGGKRNLRGELDGYLFVVATK